ncbi:hypothetical protein Nham_1597 [Nitrobacter hamburgensis X14]|uniref:TPM domain-containing protein n=2 Tax=Nitrobacter hamburgensis TaxID=912 RepID=Q1QMX9_NITHX|nr:hypothetical protein Nham_1597 [Nitrobacter hamburgensis X14]
MTTGHQFVVVTTPSLGGQDIARYATDLANERQARIVVGRGLLETRLPDAASKEIMETVIVPLFKQVTFPPRSRQARPRSSPR